MPPFVRHTCFPFLIPSARHLCQTGEMDKLVGLPSRGNAKGAMLPKLAAPTVMRQPGLFLCFVLIGRRARPSLAESLFYGSFRCRRC